VPNQPGRRPYRSADDWSEIRKQATHSITFILQLFFFCRFPPENRMSSLKTSN
jgi:hypothetical protein